MASITTENFLCRWDWKVCKLLHNMCWKKGQLCWEITQFAFVTDSCSLTLPSILKGQYNNLLKTNREQWYWKLLLTSINSVFFVICVCVIDHKCLCHYQIIQCFITTSNPGMTIQNMHMFTIWTRFHTPFESYWTQQDSASTEKIHSLVYWCLNSCTL